jgi:hypothetical protein
MPDVLYVLEVWILVSLLMGWLFCRAALRLHSPPLTFADLVEAEHALRTGAGERPFSSPEPDALLRALRVYDAPGGQA